MEKNKKEVTSRLLVLHGRGTVSVWSHQVKIILNILFYCQLFFSCDDALRSNPY